MQIRLKQKSTRNNAYNQNIWRVFTVNERDFGFSFKDI